MPTARQWARYDHDRADATLLRRAAIWLREHPDRASYAGVTRDGNAAALAALLEILATGIAGPSPAVRWQALEAAGSCSAWRWPTPLGAGPDAEPADTSHPDPRP